MVVTEKLGVNISKKYEKKERMWKRRLEKQVQGLRQDLSGVECLTIGKTLKVKTMNRLERKYNLSTKGNSVVKEELKQRLVAKANTIKRYTDRVEQYRQNRLFGFDQSKFYAELDKEPSDEYIPPNPQDAKDFWSGIWSNEKVGT